MGVFRRGLTGGVGWANILGSRGCCMETGFWDRVRGSATSALEELDGVELGVHRCLREVEQLRVLLKRIRDRPEEGSQLWSRVRQRENLYRARLAELNQATVRALLDRRAVSGALFRELYGEEEDSGSAPGYSQGLSGGEKGPQ